MLRRASDRIRPTFQQLLALIGPLVGGDGWQVQWHRQGVIWRYRGLGDLRIRVNVQAAWVNMHARSFREGDKRFRFWWWKSVRKSEDLGEEFQAALTRQLARVVELTDRYLSLKARR